jgi:thymidylate kinase
MLIILEGPDGAGKSTLAESLSDEIVRQSTRDATVEILHKGPPAEGATILTEYMDPLLDYRPGGDRHVICDRWHLGELVYPGMLSRSSLALDRVGFAYLEMFLASRGALAVHVDAGYDTLLDVLHKRDKETVLDYEFRVSTQRARFRRAFARTRLPKYATRTGYHDPVEVVRIARTTDGVGARTYAVNPSYAGPALPRYLLLGDTRNDSPPPAFGPHVGTSGRYLLESIKSRWLENGDVGVANVNDPDSGDVIELLRIFEYPRTVALGEHAWATVQDQLASAPDVRKTVGAVPHPQHWRRFFHRYARDYARIIEEASWGNDLRGHRPPGSWNDKRKAKVRS